MERRGWDSDFFGVRIAAADLRDEALAAAVAEARADGAECLYLFTPADRVDLIGDGVDAGARLVAVREHLRLDFPVSLEHDEDVKRADAADRPLVEKLAERLTPYSRFAADPRFPRENVTELYRLWARRCLDEGAVHLDPSAEGFVATRPRGDELSVDLVYVADGAGGRGVGARLLRAALAGSSASAAVVTASTGNVRALRLYQSVGFRTAAVEAVLHLWL